MKQKTDLIGPGEAAERLGVSTEYLRRDRRNPSGPRVGYVKLPSGGIRYRASEIERVLAACTVDAVEPAVVVAAGEALVQKVVREHEAWIASKRGQA